MNRVADLSRFYEILQRLVNNNGFQSIKTFTGTQSDRGVYFFFEPGEERIESGRGRRVVRVGTHGLTTGSASAIRQRLKQHAGRLGGGGNHRGSIFRLLIGEALLAQGCVPVCRSWGAKNSAKLASLALDMTADELKSDERSLEQAVSAQLKQMPFVWLRIPDEPGPESVRGYLERNSIALLSNFQRRPLDPPSDRWLGRHSPRALVSGSGLWNQRHVEDSYEPDFLAELEALTHEHLG